MTTTVLASIPSPAQGVWHLGPFPLRAYALFIIVGIVAALVIGDRRWVARGGEPGVIYDVALWAVPFGLIGGRLYHVMTDWPTYFGENGAGPAAALRIWDGGLGIWGAVALGGVGAWIACRRRGIPLPAFGDAIAPGIVLAQAIGRLGNYFNQELYGRETTLPWGLEIYERVNSAGLSDSLNGVSNGVLVKVVHPTFLYELLWNLLVFAVLILVDRRFKIGHGRLFALYVAGYCVGRFWVELMRSDTATLLAGIRINTFTSTFVFIAAVVYIMVAPKGREAPETLRGKQDAESDVEELAKDVAMASATGVVAAATVAGQEDDSERRPGGLGAVEGDEAVEATEGAAAAHDVAVDGAAEAEALAAELDVADEDAVEEAAEGDGDVVAPPVPEEAGGLGAIEGDEAVEATEGAAAAGQAVTSDEPAAPEGLGLVEGDEVAEAVAEAPDAHEVAVEGEAVAEELAAEAAELDAEPAAEVGEVDAAAVTDVDSEGLGSVEGVEVAEAVAEAPEAHEVAVEGEAAAEELAAELDAESDESAAAEVPEGDAGSVTEAEGLGSVEGDEVAEAVAEAPEAHEVAVEDEVVAEELAAESDESAAAEVPEGDAGSVTEAEGLGSVEGDEVAEAVAEAPEAHEVAVEDEAVAEELAAESDECAAAEVPEGDAGSVTEAEGLGSVEGDEVAEAVAEATEAHEVAVDGEAAVEELAAELDAESLTEADGDKSEVPDSAETVVDGEPESAVASDAEKSPYSIITESSDARTQFESGGRVRQWLRRRRNR
ncbi:prolipoprotein diacylglyceryl transferase [Mycolicibacterium iranicum]|uniref:Phosphatidylglycerol--prolipoprotein diacylglyceryl transferase n=1 Tax=Mycolicibacterium iranicum TaxID=912594 RepID=A0A1X1WL95_MYCIR|nr:prolipoprotein diacylglyceryl transferase [Mycolicibacterium iranicum]ORV87376.1 prolipoprotein diacylglyceryl transferase [Mycolicibacterium iranicum]